MVELENNFYDSEDDEEVKINPIAHKNLLEGVNSLRKTQYIKVPTRSEPTLVQDEYHLVKSSIDNKSAAVSVNDLVNILKKSNKHLKIAKDLKKVHDKKKVLEKPLEKPVADRIHRQIGYEKTKKKLGRWDAVVAQNRYAEQQVC